MIIKEWNVASNTMSCWDHVVTLHRLSSVVLSTLFNGQLQFTFLCGLLSSTNESNDWRVSLYVH